MRINVSKRFMASVSLLVLVVLVIIIVRIISCIFQTRDFKRIDATIVSVDGEYDEYSSGDTTIVHKICFTYEINKSVYKNSFEELTKLGYSKGKNITIYYNPDNPEEIRPNMRSESIAGLGTLVIFILCLIMTMKAD